MGNLRQEVQNVIHCMRNCRIKNKLFFVVITLAREHDMQCREHVLFFILDANYAN